MTLKSIQLMMVNQSVVANLYNDPADEQAGNAQDASLLKQAEVALKEAPWPSSKAPPASCLPQSIDFYIF
jgi:hypothetical protein